MRVQGRWAASARLAYVRVLYQSATDVSGGKLLTKTAPNVFPKIEYFKNWASFFESVFIQHKNNIIEISHKNSISNSYSYTINLKGVRQFIAALCGEKRQKPKEWSLSDWRGFVRHAVRGFLRADLFTAVTEFQARAEGSFGLQVHSTLEPGVVIITSKGQPMSVSYDTDIPIVLFGSEAEAVAVPVSKSGMWLKNRIDLNSKGEVMRIGLPSPMFDGNYTGEKKFVKTKLLLNCGFEIRSYLIDDAYEVPLKVLKSRISLIRNPPAAYDPRVDLVGNDIKDIPKVIKKINDAWADKNSDNCFAASTLWEKLLISADINKTKKDYHIDLLMLGVEGSLWIAEQFASDLRRIFPTLVIVTESSNKTLNFEGSEASGIIDTILPLRVNEFTCILLISQSGQTFPTLHSTRRFASLPYYQNIWILTGCIRSKMETAIEEAYLLNGKKYTGGRVLDNYSGNRPAGYTNTHTFYMHNYHYSHY